MERRRVNFYVWILYSHFLNLVVELQCLLCHCTHYDHFWALATEIVCTWVHEIARAEKRSLGLAQGPNYSTNFLGDPIVFHAFPPAHSPCPNLAEEFSMPELDFVVFLFQILSFFNFMENYIVKVKRLENTQCILFFLLIEKNPTLTIKFGCCLYNLIIIYLILAIYVYRVWIYHH